MIAIGSLPSGKKHEFFELETLLVSQPKSRFHLNVDLVPGRLWREHLWNRVAKCKLQNWPARPWFLDGSTGIDLRFRGVGFRLRDLDGPT